MNYQAIVFVSTLAASCLWMNAAAVEEAAYRVIEKENAFEIREYAPQLLAEIVVSEDFEAAGDEAFDPLFRYISGDNRSSEKISMTAPVSQKSAGTSAGELIRMTSPVRQETSADDWVISFTMPSSYVPETVPVPTNPEIKIRSLPAQQFVAIRYSGFWDRESYLEKRAALEEWILERGLTITGSPVWARYNPPFTPWFVRRNEVLIPIGDYKADADGRI